MQVHIHLPRQPALAWAVAWLLAVRAPRAEISVHAPVPEAARWLQPAGHRLFDAPGPAGSEESAGSLWTFCREHRVEHDVPGCLILAPPSQTATLLDLGQRGMARGLDVLNLPPDLLRERYRDTHPNLLPTDGTWRGLLDLEGGWVDGAGFARALAELAVNCGVRVLPAGETAAIPGAHQVRAAAVKQPAGAFDLAWEARPATDPLPHLVSVLPARDFSPWMPTAFTESETLHLGPWITPLLGRFERCRLALCSRRRRGELRELSIGNRQRLQAALPAARGSRGNIAWRQQQAYPLDLDLVQAGNSSRMRTSPEPLRLLSEASRLVDRFLA